MTYKNDWDDAVWDDELGEFVPANGTKEKEDVVETKDSNGNVLANGDTVSLIKDLDVKGSSLSLKRGTKVKVKLIDDPELIECKQGKSTIFLKTCFLKK